MKVSLRNGEEIVGFVENEMTKDLTDLITNTEKTKGYVGKIHLGSDNPETSAYSNLKTKPVYGYNPGNKQTEKSRNEYLQYRRSTKAITYQVSVLVLHCTYNCI